MSQTRFLNLDDLPTAASVMTIRHEGTDHAMVELTVESFIDQQKRADQHADLVAKVASMGDATVDQAQNLERQAVEITRDAIREFFPTLPVDTLPVRKLFAIFAWLNDFAADVNAAGVEGQSDAEGNVSGETN